MAEGAESASEDEVFEELLPSRRSARNAILLRRKPQYEVRDENCPLPANRWHYAWR